MTLPEDWWDPKHLEQEPCDRCGVVPSRHRGHGSYTCKPCWDASFCPLCKYWLAPHHVCPTPAEQKVYEEDMAATLKAIGVNEEEG